MSTGKELILALLLVALLIVTAFTLIGAASEQAACEAKGGKRLRGTSAWDGFECYDRATLKVLR
jgi:hypothetical protein